MGVRQNVEAFATLFQPMRVRDVTNLTKRRKYKGYKQYLLIINIIKVIGLAPVKTCNHRYG